MRARKILIERNDALVGIAEHLLEVETIDGEQLDRLIEQSERKSFESEVQKLIEA